jgi:hypothetical protein
MIGFRVFGIPDCIACSFEFAFLFEVPKRSLYLRTKPALPSTFAQGIKGYIALYSYREQPWRDHFVQEVP